MDAMFDYADALQPAPGATFDCDDVFMIDNLTNDKESFGIFPNPSSGIFTIKDSESENFILVIYDLTGNIILPGEVSDDGVIDISSQPTGMYILQIKTGLMVR